MRALPLVTLVLALGACSSVRLSGSAGGASSSAAPKPQERPGNEGASGLHVPPPPAASEKKTTEVPNTLPPE